MSRSTALKLQMWGNSIALRIPSAIARRARLSAGQTVEICVAETGLTVVPAGKRDLSLGERLRQYDPVLHGGEAMAVRRVGNETM